MVAVLYWWNGYVHAEELQVWLQKRKQHETLLHALSILHPQPHSTTLTHTCVTVTLGCMHVCLTEGMQQHNISKWSSTPLLAWIQVLQCTQT